MATLEQRVMALEILAYRLVAIIATTHQGALEHLRFETDDRSVDQVAQPENVRAALTQLRRLLDTAEQSLPRAE
jgi:hypothetical protein